MVINTVNHVDHATCTSVAN